MSSNLGFELFKRASSTIPAYRQFLTDQNFDPSSVQTAEDFVKVPHVTKDNYLRKYSLNQIVWPDAFSQTTLFCSTSGSTGAPYYFPRNDKLSEQYSYLIEDFLKRSHLNNPKTLVILGFGMGVWIGGVVTLRAFEIAGARMNAPISILPAGYNKVEIMKALKNLAPQFEQTIIVGYPPFVKELIDECEDQAIAISQLNPRFLFAAEAFTETFRDYLCEKAGVANTYNDTLNIYGTADIGAMAYETPLSILVRRLSIQQPELFQSIFGQISKTPTLAQYNPDFMQFEAVDGEILLSGDSSLPLIRYAVGDHGGVYSFEEMEQTLQQHGIDLSMAARNAGIKGDLARHPFVFVYERKDLSATLHGINLYPEFVKEALLSEMLNPFFTERFTMITKNDENQNQYLEINLELRNGVEQSKKITTAAHQLIHNMLMARSSEYSEIAKTVDAARLIQVVTWPKDYEVFFAPGTKQKWTMKST